MTKKLYKEYSDSTFTNCKSLVDKSKTAIIRSCELTYKVKHGIKSQKIFVFEKTDDTIKITLFTNCCRDTKDFVVPTNIDKKRATEIERANKDDKHKNLLNRVKSVTLPPGITGIERGV